MSSGIILFVFLALLSAWLLRKAGARFGFTAPTTTAVVVVFMLVVAALYGQSLD